MTDRSELFVDCSSNNPMPDLDAYKRAGHKHLCRKVSEGTGYHWYEGDGLTDQAHDLGLRVGNYHWLSPNQSAVDQAVRFVSLVKPHLKPGDWLMTDYERTANVVDPSDAARAMQLRDFNNHVGRALSDYPLYVYTGNWYLAGHTAMQTECRRWPVVMSDYSGADVLPNPYGLTYVAWQFTDRATVAGFSAPVDYNRWLKAPEEGFVMDKDAKDRFDKIEGEVSDVKQAVDALQRTFDAVFGDSDGDRHKLRTWLSWASGNRVDAPHAGEGADKGKGGRK